MATPHDRRGFVLSIPVERIERVRSSNAPLLAIRHPEGSGSDLRELGISERGRHSTSEILRSLSLGQDDDASKSDCFDR
jgi:hypothetical protein